MWNYEFMKETIIMTAFIFIIMLDIWGIGYWVVTLVKWIIKKLRKKKDEAADETEAAAAMEEQH